ncbi:MAG: amino acid ABC transporter substrate-binding protein [Pasteurella sp.]|nr:amino acid ABC transporter substrate-binding protein [Pasteurella sp.]
MSKINHLGKIIAIFTSLSFFCVGAETIESNNEILKRIQEKGTITIGTEGTYAPFSYHDESGKLTGYDVEVARAVAKKLGVQVDFKETQWDAMLAGLNSKRFDLVANQVSLTSPERQKKYDTTSPYSYSGAVVVARSENSINSWKSLKGLKSAQSLTSNYVKLVEQNGAEAIGVDGLAQALQLVAQKRVDVTINDRLAVLDFLKKQPSVGLKIVLQNDQRVSSGFVFNKGNQNSIVLFDEALKELREEGVLKRLGEQFFGEDVSVQ